MKKLVKIVSLMIITMFLMTINALAADFSVNADIQKQDKEIILKISLGELEFTGAGMNGFICDIEYDRSVFEIVKEEDIKTKNGWTDLTYNEENGALLLLRDDFTKNKGEELVEIKFKQKDNAKQGETEIKITNIQATNSQEDLDADTKSVKLKIDAKTSILKNILIVILIIILVLLVLRIIVRTQVKRRKRR